MVGVSQAQGLEAAVDRACGRWIAFIEQHPGRVLGVVLLLTIFLGVYVGRNLSFDSDPTTLIDEQLPFQRRQRALTDTFSTLGDGILVVIEANSPFAAGRAADTLAARLSERKDLFAQIEVPGGGPFFARNALLYLAPEQLDELADRLSAAQPFLAELAKDESLVGIADLIRQALASERAGTRVGIDLATALDRVSAAVEATTEGRPASDPWGSALLGGTLPAEARRRVVAIRPKLDYRALLGAAPAVDAIREAARDLGLTAERGIQVRITGEPILNYEELLAISAQSRAIAIISFLLFTGCVCFALRSLRIVLALTGSLLVSLVWSNALAAAAVGQLNQISAAFNVLLIGLGGEFGIHACMRYSELLRAGRPPREALVETGSSIGSSLFSSAGTTAIGFFIFLLTDFTGVAQLGLITGTGMFISLASTLTVLPALLAVGSPTPPRVSVATPPWIARIGHLPLAYAAPIRIAAAAAAVVGLALLPRVRYDTNVLNLRDPQTESVQTFKDLLAGGGMTPWTIDVVAPDLSTAATLASRIASLETVKSARTLLDYVPRDQDEKIALLETASYFVPPFTTTALAADDAAQRAALERLTSEATVVGRLPAGDASEGTELARGDLAVSARRLETACARFLASAAEDPRLFATLQANVVGSLPEQVRDLGPLLSPERVTLDDLPPELRERMLAPDGRARIEVVPSEDVSDGGALERFVDSVHAVVPDAAGRAVWLVEWGRVTWRAMRAALLGGMACMIIFLVCLWRSVWDPLLAFFPLALAALLTCASLVVLGQPFNFANVIVLPMLVGMGVDSGVHLVHRHRTDPKETDVLATGTARAVFFAALTTILSFGSLGLAPHRGMAAIGQLLTIGVTLTLVCYLVVLPAVLEWDDRRRRETPSRGGGRLESTDSLPSRVPD